jgi:phosphatidate cytidylyltransferase
VTRILTAAVLLPIVVGVVWFLPPIFTLLLVAVVAALAFVEYATMARRGSEGFPTVLSGTATVVVCAATGWGVPLAHVLGPALILVGAAAIARGRPDEDALRLAAVALFPVLYLGVPLGLAVTIGVLWGPPALVLPFLVIVISDSSQYFGGRAFGRHPLAPAISPKKTIEGAVCGFLVTTAALLFLGPALVSGVSTLAWLAAGPLLVAAGIAGDLFESLVKRSVGVKDSSGLLPGHGGMLDRIDALLFAFPAFYLLMVFSQSGPALP